MSVPSEPFMGGKRHQAKDILDRAPIKTGRKFVDLCAGRGALTIRAWDMGLKFSQWIINDPNTVPDWWIPLSKIGKKIKVPPRSRAEFEKQRSLATQGDRSRYEVLRALVLAPWLCYAGGFYSKGGSYSALGGGRRTPEAEEKNLRRFYQLIKERKPTFSALDWLDCLRAEEVDSRDLVVIDYPYIDCETYVYNADDVLPIEVIDYLLHHPELNWLLCEQPQPLYLEALGPPVWQKTVQMRVNVGQMGRRETREECVWTSESVKAYLAKTGRSVGYNTSASIAFNPPKVDFNNLNQVVAALKACVPRIENHRLYIQKELREQLLPLILALGKLTKRKKPGFHKTLKSIGLNASTVRGWFYASETGKTVIDLLEDEPKKIPKPRKHGKPAKPAKREEIQTPEEIMLADAYRMATAVMENRISDAKKIAREFLEAWHQDHDLAQAA
jgi:hypothetical protein